MSKVAVFNMEGAQVGEMDLNADVFDRQVNIPVMHQAVTLYLASQRRGTHSTKTKGLVSGGGKKPWKQKGTGRARTGSIRNPLWRGGGIIFGPQPRSYGFSMPRKLRRLALVSALSDKAQNNNLIVIENLSLEAPKTKTMVALLSKLGTQNALLVVGKGEENVQKSSCNLPKVLSVEASGINTYNVLYHDKLIISKDALALIEEVLG